MSTDLTNIQVRQALPNDAEAVSSVLREAAAWLDENRLTLWQETELSSSRIEADLAAQLFWLAEAKGEIIGTVMFQLEDRMFWPDAVHGDAAYIHRLAIRRSYAGTGLSTAILDWAVQHTHALGRQWLRLDCFADRPRLRAIYERFGFQYRDDRQVGPYYVARYQYDVTRHTLTR